MTEAFNLDETLQKGIRAARRGHRAPAQRLLSEVLQADPNNEEAWLWLASVAGTPEQRTHCLQRVIALNPDNQWAAEQLAEMEQQPSAPAEAAKETASSPAPQLEPSSGELKLKTLGCPHCGGTVELQGGDQTKTAVCNYCRSVLDLTAEQATVINQINKKIAPSLPITLGMEGTFAGERHQVIGWLRYEGWDDEDRWRWDEWLLASASGQFRWLSYDDEEGFTLYKKITPARPFNPKIAAAIPVEGGDAKVKERAPAKIIALLGELTWRARVGETLEYIDAEWGGKRYSAEVTPTELELHEGKAMTEVEVWQAFGRDDLIKQVEKVEAGRKPFQFLMAVAALLMLLSCCGSFYATLSGETLLPAQSVTLTPGEAGKQIIPFEVKSPGAVHQISLQTSLPTNSWAEVEVSVFDTQNNEFDLSAKEFWDETGSDDEGPWHENDLSSSHLFMPDEAGPYQVQIAMDEATVSSLTVQVTVEDNIILSRYFILYAVICGGLVVLFYVLAYRKSSQAVNLVKEKESK
jgi:hypothetical protein